MTDLDLPVSFRLSGPEDRSFIIHSWLKSFRNDHQNKFISNEVYYPEQERIVKLILDRANTFITYLDDEPNSIIAWLCYEYLGNNCVLHYGYTKGQRDLYRGLGLQSAMLKLVQQGKRMVMTTFPRQETLFAHLETKHHAIYDPYYLARLI